MLQGNWKRIGQAGITAAALMAIIGLGIRGGGYTGSEDKRREKENEVVSVGFSQVGSESDWRTAHTIAMKETFCAEKGYELLFEDAQQQQKMQIMAVRNFIQQGVDYIVLAPVVEDGWDTVLKEAKETNIPVIIMDRRVEVEDEDLYAAWVGADFKKQGEKACEWLKAYWDKNGSGSLDIVNIQGTLGATAQIGRTEALEEAAKRYGWNILEQQPGEFTQAKAEEIMAAYLKKYDNIDVVYCENDNEALGALEAIRKAGKKAGPDGDMIVISFDATRAGLEKTLTGEIMLDVECNPLQAQQVEQVIRRMEEGQEVKKEIYIREGIYAYGGALQQITVDGETYRVTKVTEELIDQRNY